VAPQEGARPTCVSALCSSVCSFVLSSAFAAFRSRLSCSSRAFRISASSLERQPVVGRPLAVVARYPRICRWIAAAASCCHAAANNILVSEADRIGAEGIFASALRFKLSRGIAAAAAAQSGVGAIEAEGRKCSLVAMLICPPMEGWKHGCAAIRLHRLVLWLSTSARTYRVVFLLGPSSAAWVVRPCPTVPARRLLPPPPLQYQRLPCSRPRPPQTARARTARQASRRNRRLGVHGRHRRTGMMRLGCTHGWQDILSLGRQTRRKRVLAATMVKRSIQRALSVASAIFCNSYLR